MGMSKTLILKVLSGSQLGVEIGLSDGEYSFGSGPDADIQFADLSMAASHGQLRLAGGKVELRATGAAIQTASGLVIPAGDGEWREIAQLDRITAGTSVFAIGGADANWTSLATAPAQVVERRAEPALQGRLNRNWMIGGGVLAACILGVLLLTGGGSSLPIAARTTPDENLRLVKDTLADLSFRNDLDVTVEADGTITVAGYVETGTERRAVQNALQDLSFDVRRRIWALEALRTDISGLIASQNIQVDYTLEPDGQLILSGIWLDEEAVTRTVGILQSEVFGLAGITDNVRVANDFLEESKALLVKLQLDELVLARLDGMLIETTGVVPSDKMDNWVGFMRAYADQIAPHLPLRSFVTLDGQADAATVPVIIGGPETDASGARVVEPDTLESGVPDPSSLFAQSDTAPPPAVPAAETAVDAPPEAAAEIDPELAQYEALINDFASQNPEVVATLIQALTNGQFNNIEGLRAFFATRADTAPDGAAADSLPEGPTVSDPEAIVEILNAEAGEPVTADVATAAFDPAQVIGRLNAALALLFDTSGNEPELTADARSGNPELAAVSKEMISMAEAQEAAMARGETLLTPAPAPLEAEASVTAPVGPCWPGSNVTVEGLPTLLLWMDILSISTNLDILKVRPDSGVLFMEAALNPDRIRACLEGLNSEFGADLIRNSVFLQETARNDLFAAFLMRNVPNYPLDIAGISLEEKRYAHLSDGRKLGEGAAPGVDSRLLVIGDLGLLIRVSDGYRVNLYRDDIGWLISGK